jgi:adenine deaminase
VLDKVAVALGAGKLIDGHAPGLAGSALASYAACQVHTDHECADGAELQEKVQTGMYVLLREGSACKDLQNLLKGVTAANARRCLFCTDDRQPKSILSEGHLDNHLRIAVASGLDPMAAVRMATLNAAECYGLHDRGAIAPGRRADLVVVEDLESFAVKSVFCLGTLVAQAGKYHPKHHPMVPATVGSRVHVANFSVGRLVLPLTSNEVRVIDVREGSVVTGSGTALVQRDDRGNFVHDPLADVVKLAVVERHHGTGNIGLALLRGYGIRHGAVATTIAHDSHNIIVAGDNDADMALAVETVVGMGGGLVMIKEGQVLDTLPLPIAGLMSDGSGEDVARAFDRMHEAAHASLVIRRGIDPFMTLSFMALPVIPELKVTDMGLFDVGAFRFVPISIEHE